MFRTSKPLYLISLVCVLLTCNRGVSGQVPENEVQEMRAQAMGQYEEGNYARAGEIFTQLIRQFPRDAMYRYYAGICKMEQGKDLEEAVEMLYYASTRGVPEDVYYYLGEAYRRMYDFERAKKYFLSFDREAPRSMTREYDSKLLIRSVNTAVQLTSSYNPYEVQNVTFIDMKDPEQMQQIKMKGGNLTKKPELFFSEQEDAGDLNAWMFMPRVLARGQTVFFAGPDRKGRSGFQIMQARYGNTGRWTDIEPVDALNTDGDEILPYYDPVGKDIYFASDGKEGIGGFDLYRSHYDEERDQWSEPVSLGFPVNSAYDDYLLLPGTDLGMVTFFSARQSSDTAIAVYRVHLSEPKQSLASKSPREIRKIANLDNVALQMMEEFEAYNEMLADSEADEKIDHASDAGAGAVTFPGEKEATSPSGSPKQDREMQRTFSDVPGKLPSAGSVDSVYQALIGSALRHQAVSDSLTELATAARVRVRESDDPNEKWLSQRQIMVWERKAAGEQQQADRYFVQIEDYQQSLPPSVLEKDTVINDITVYSFSGSDGESEKEVVRPDVEEKAKAVFSSSDEKQVPGETIAGIKDNDRTQSRNTGNAAPKQFVPDPVRDNEQLTGAESGTADRPKEVAGGPGRNMAVSDGAFEIRSSSPYSEATPIPVDVSLPRGTLYRIQMGVYSSEVDPSIYGGITPITAMKDEARSLIFYYAGNFRTYDAARDALALIRAEGFTDAFIVSWFNGAKMSLEKTRKLEK